MVPLRSSSSAKLPMNRSNVHTPVSVKDEAMVPPLELGKIGLCRPNKTPRALQPISRGNLALMLFSNSFCR